MLRDAEVCEYFHDIITGSERYEDGPIPAYAGDDLHGDDDVPVVLDHLFQPSQGGVRFSREDRRGSEMSLWGRTPVLSVVTELVPSPWSGGG